MSISEPNNPVPPDSLGEVHRQSPGSPGLLALRLIALVGACAVVGWHLTAHTRMEPRQNYGFAVLVFAAVAVPLTLFVLLRGAAGRLLRYKDLLVPLGLYVTADALLSFVATLPALAGLFAPNWPVKVASISIVISLLFVTQLILGVLYAGWTTTLVLQAVRGDRVDLVGAIADVRRWFLRVLAVLFVGWAVLFVGLAAVIPVAGASIGLALVLIGVGALIWNLATAALLPVAVAEGGPIGSAIRSGFRVSWAGKRRWWVPVVAQMLMLGWITYVHVSFTRNPRPGVVQHQTRTSWNVHAFWTGGYENTCHWHNDVMKAVETSPLPLISTLMGLLFGVLAIAVKLRIANDVYSRPPPEPDDVLDDVASET